MTRKASILLLAGVLSAVLAGCPNPEGPKPIVCERLVIDTFPPITGTAATDTTLRLYDDRGRELAFDDNNPNVPFDYQPSARIDYTEGLPAGTYYVKVYSAIGNPGDYVVRVLDLALTDSLPAYELPEKPSTEGYPDGDDEAVGNVPVNPLDIDFGNANQRNRNLWDEADVDWLRIVIP